MELLYLELNATPGWVLSGSVAGWGDVFIPRFDMVVFLTLDASLGVQGFDPRSRYRHEPPSIAACAQGRARGRSRL